MSNAASTWAQRQRIVRDPSARHILLLLADAAWPDGSNAFRSVGTLAEESGLSERCVRQKLRHLEEVGAIARMDDAVARAYIGRADRVPYVYRLAMHGGQDVPPVELHGGQHVPSVENNGGQSASARGANGDCTGGSTCPQSLKKPKKKPVKTLQQAATSPAGRLRADPEDLAVARWLHERVRRIVPDAREPNWLAWGNEVRLMRERDGRTVGQIQELFAWANADGFWAANVLSPRKLRERWEQLQANRAQVRGRARGFDAVAYLSERQGGQEGPGSGDARTIDVPMREVEPGRRGD